MQFIPNDIQATTMILKFLIFILFQQQIAIDISEDYSAEIMIYLNS
jgi:hypothetical protein